MGKCCCWGSAANLRFGIARSRRAPVAAYRRSGWAWVMQPGYRHRSASPKVRNQHILTGNRTQGIGGRNCHVNDRPTPPTPHRSRERQTTALVDLRSAIVYICSPRQPSRGAPTRMAQRMLGLCGGTEQGLPEISGTRRDGTSMVAYSVQTCRITPEASATDRWFSREAIQSGNFVVGDYTVERIVRHKPIANRSSRPFSGR